MILKKEHIPNILAIEESPYFQDEEKEFIKEFIKIEYEFRYALQEFSAKLDNLNDYCQMTFDHNPIHHIESRIKTAASLIEKIKRRGFQMSLGALGSEIFDIAGMRVICPYLNDIYRIIDLLSRDENVKIINKKDYILKPKASGYRSLHIIFSVDLCIAGIKKSVPIEVQFRTIAEDMWASLEHELRYKSETQLSEADSFRLKQYSDQLYEIDLNMQRLFISKSVGDLDVD